MMEANFKIREKNEKESYVQLYLTANNKRYRFATPYTISTKDWASGYPKQISATKNLRVQLDTLKGKIDLYIKDTINRKDRLPSKLEISSQIELVTGKKERPTYSTLLAEYLSKKEIKKSTRQQIDATFRLLKDFAPRIELIDIDKKFARSFTTHLSESDLLNQTINKHHKNVKAFCNWLFEEDHTTTNLGKYFKNLKAQDKPIIALSNSEIEAIENCMLSQRLEKAKHLFLFSCYTGLRFEDLQQVKKEAIQNDVLTIRQQKTNALIKIPLEPEALQILEQHDFQLPQLSNQKANQYIKELFTLLKLNRKVLTTKHQDKFVPLNQAVSFHVSRKTFITLALARNIPAKIVQAISGHKSDEIFNSYIQFSDDILKNAMVKSRRKKESVDELKSA